MIIFHFIFLNTSIPNLTNAPLLIQLASFPVYVITQDKLNNFIVAPLISEHYSKQRARFIPHKFSYKISVGNDFLCTENNKIFPCFSYTDSWDIGRVSFGFYLKYEGKCLSVSKSRLCLERCRMDKKQIFNFVPLESNECLKEAGDLNEPPIDARQKLAREHLKKEGKLDKDGRLKSRPKSFEDYVDKHKPELKNKNKIKKVLDKLYKKTHDRPKKKNSLSGYRWSFPWFSLFCPFDMF